MPVLVCSDRDGTINRDDDFYLGSSLKWKTQVEILPKVINGVRLINSIPDSHFFIVTNQSGVALRGPEFDLLTEERMHEVNRHIIGLLEKQSARVSGYFACPYVNTDYAEKSGKMGKLINPAYVCEGHPDIKPRVGMLEKAAALIGAHLTGCRLYFQGDRASDVQIGLNGGGTGILIPNLKTHELGDLERVEKLAEKFPGRVYIARDFLDAAEFIVKDML